MEEKQGEFRQDYGEFQRHRHSSSQSCLVKASNGFVSGAVLGATMSGLSGMARAAQMQIRSACSPQTIVGGLFFGLGFFRV